MERVAIVGHGACEHDLEVETADGLAVKVNIFGYHLLFLFNRHPGHALLKLEHDLLAAFHRLDVTVNLACHLVAHKLVYACHLYFVLICGFEIFLCNFVFLFHSVNVYILCLYRRGRLPAPHICFAQSYGFLVTQQTKAPTF